LPAARPKTIRVNVERDGIRARRCGERDFALGRRAVARSGCSPQEKIAGVHFTAGAIPQADPNACLAARNAGGKSVQARTAVVLDVCAHQRECAGDRDAGDTHRVAGAIG
jgi:hypothetical protein